MPLQVRAMTPADIPAALELWTGTEGIELGESDRPAAITSYLNRNPGLSSIAAEAGRLVAAVLCGHDGRRGFVYHLAVAKDRRGQGVGRAVMKRSLEALKSEGIARVLLLVFADNSAGREFWLREGWEDMTFARAMGIDL